MVVQIPYTWGYADSINRIRRDTGKVVEVVSTWGNQKAISGGTTVPITIVTWKKSEISPSDIGIFPGTIGIKLVLFFCTIPTVGLYGKLGEITATHFLSNIKHIHGAAAATRRRLYRR